MPFVPGSGRRQAVEWLEVTRIDNSSKVMCKHCNVELTSKVERIRAHLKNKCSKRKRDDKTTSNEQVLNDPLPPIQISTTASAPSTSNCLLHEQSPFSIAAATSQKRSYDSGEAMLPARASQAKMSRFTVTTNMVQQKEICTAIGNFFFANGIPFNAASSKEYTRMMKLLRPGFIPPGRKEIAGHLLDECFENVELQLQQEINESTTITLMIDGWSSIRNEPIVATSMHTGKNGYLLNVIDCGAEKKTAEYCAEIAYSAIKEVKENYNINVFALCSDNENKMKKMKELVEIKYPTILTYGCSAHFLNLLEKDITPKTVLNYIVEVNKYFRNHHLPHGLLKEKGGLMPQIPNDTRWNSQEECVNTFIKNFHKYVEIANEDDNFDSNISKILSNIGLYRESLTLQKQLKEVSVALDRLQSDSANFSTAVEVWLDLTMNVELLPYKDYIKQMMDRAVEPFFYVGNLVDPSCFGNRLSAEQENKGEMWLQTMKPEYVPGFLALKIQDNQLFPENMFHKDLIQLYKDTPSKWWVLMERNTQKVKKLPDGFCTFFAQLLTCPPSSASIERIFSTFGNIWTKLRNRLGAEKAGKLVKIQRFLKKNMEESETGEW